jgi:hypothetical protein
LCGPASQAVPIYSDYQFNAPRVKGAQEITQGYTAMNSYFIATVALLTSLITLTLPLAVGLSA